MLTASYLMLRRLPEGTGPCLKACPALPCPVCWPWAGRKPSCPLKPSCHRTPFGSKGWASPSTLYPHTPRPQAKIRFETECFICLGVLDGLQHSKRRLEDFVKLCMSKRYGTQWPTKASGQKNHATRGPLFSSLNTNGNQTFG